MNQLDFQPHTETHTVVYDANGKEIDRFPGIVEINGSDYADRLPLKYQHVSVTTTVLNSVVIEPKNNTK